MGRLLKRCGTREVEYVSGLRAVHYPRYYCASHYPSVHTDGVAHSRDEETRYNNIYLSNLSFNEKNNSTTICRTHLSHSPLAANGVSFCWWLFFWERLVAVHLRFGMCSVRQTVEVGGIN
jgi:hypothetical protein